MMIFRQQHPDQISDWLRLLKIAAARNIKKRKFEQQQECAKGNHAPFFIEHLGFSQGLVNWHCSNCGTSWSTPDLEFTK